MKLYKIFKNAILITVACLALSACATSKKSTGQKGSEFKKHEKL